MPSSRSMMCPCGQPAFKLKGNAPVCRRCDEFEERGCIGGPNNVRVGTKMKSEIKRPRKNGNETAHQTFAVAAARRPAEKIITG